MRVKDWPVILGLDVVGEIVEIGSAVTGFNNGDRVAAAVPSIFLGEGPKGGGYQSNPVTPAIRLIKLPDTWSSQDSSALPSGMGTAAAALFIDDFLGLSYPKVPAAKNNGKVLLVWGGSAITGACAIQLAVQAGYEVIATASPHNFAFVKSLGAAKVFDYKESNTIDDIVAYLKGREKDYVGAFDAVPPRSGPVPAAYIASKLGLTNSIVMTTFPLQSKEGQPDGVEVIGCKLRFLFFHPSVLLIAALFSQW